MWSVYIITSTVKCTVYTVQCTLYSAHCTMYVKFSFRGTTVSEVKKYKFLNVSASASRCNIFVSSLQEQVYQHFMESKKKQLLLVEVYEVRLSVCRDYHGNKTPKQIITTCCYLR